MASTLNALSTGSGGLVSSGDASGVLALQTNGTTTMTLDTSGNVGIGTTTPTATGGYDKAIDLVGGSNGAGLYIRGATNPSTVYASIQYDNYSNRTNINAVGTSNFLRFVTVDAERMRITSGGALLLNATSQISTTTYLSVQGSTNATNLSEWKDTQTTYSAGNYYQVYWNSTNGVAGGIAHTAATTVAFSTSSDVRLKQNIVDAPSVLDKVLNAKVRSFDWKEDNHHVQYGFIAQELYQHLPEAVGKGDDSETIENPNGTWQVEYGRLTPMLVKAIQELKAINDTQAEELSRQAATINALVARIEALENK